MGSTPGSLQCAAAPPRLSPRSKRSMPQPWDRASFPAFLFGNSSQLRRAFTSLRSAFEARLKDDVRMRGPNRTSFRLLFAGLRARGLRWSELGMDLTRLQHNDNHKSPMAVLHDHEVQRALRLVLGDSWNTSKLERLGIFECDQPNRQDHCTFNRSTTNSSQTGGSQGPAEAARPLDAQMLQSLHWHGFAKVSDWGLDLRRLVQQANSVLEAEALQAQKKSGEPPGKISKLLQLASLPALKPLLENASIANALSSYLGGPVRFDGIQLLRLTDNVTTINNPSALWHHDRCGRRLKMFIFLHEVQADGRPTLVAKSSHNTLYYSHGKPWNLLSRYTDDYVRAKHRVVPMTGPGGGGFVFDTNALHRANPLGIRPRDVVILEFHPHGKVGHMLSLDNPCPSIKQSKKIPVRHWRDGIAGLDLYPTESLANGTTKYKRRVMKAASLVPQWGSTGRASLTLATATDNATDNNKWNPAQPSRRPFQEVMDKLNSISNSMMLQSVRQNESMAAISALQAANARLYAQLMGMSEKLNQQLQKATG